MFAPPPAPSLSRAEIQARLLQAKRGSAGSGSGTSSRTSSQTEPRSPPLQQQQQQIERKDSESPKPTRKRRVFSRPDKRKNDSTISAPVSPPLPSSPPSLPPPPPPPVRESVEARRNDVNAPGLRAETPGKRRQAPRRPVRPPSELVALSVGAWDGFAAAETKDIPAKYREAPPPVPSKSPLRQNGAGLSRQNGMRQGGRVKATETSLDAIMAGLSVNEGLEGGESAPTPRTRMASVTSDRPDSMILSKPAAGRKRETVDSVLGPKATKVNKTQARRSSATTVRTEALDIANIPTSNIPRRLTEGAVPSSQTHRQTTLKRQQQGETMSMLVTSGFFPSGGSVLYSTDNPNVNVHVPAALHFAEKDLPDTPNSIVGTPTEMYQPGTPRTSIVSRNRKLTGNPKRSPLAQIAENSAKVNSNEQMEDTSASAMSPSRLSAIPEAASFIENSPPTSGTATPVATQIHLRGGSVLTLTPPEMTAWRQTIYIQGPIRLPKPVIMPRKGSVASLEPFQEAIDQVYQDALHISRRRSDDATVDEICDFFDTFGFSDVHYEGDLLLTQNIDVDEVDEMDTDSDSKDGVPKRFSTPPTSPPAATPVEKSVAKDMVQTTVLKMPPVETEERLRAKGIARLSHLSASNQGSNSSHVQTHRRGSSNTLAKNENVLPLLPLPEDSMLDAVMDASHGNDVGAGEFTQSDGFVDQGGMDWDDEVEETDGSASWVSPAAQRRNRMNRGGQSSRDKNNPVAKMWRFVATASAIL